MGFDLSAPARRRGPLAMGGAGLLVVVVGLGAAGGHRDERSLPADAAPSQP